MCLLRVSTPQLLVIVFAYEHDSGTATALFANTHRGHFIECIPPSSKHVPRYIASKLYETCDFSIRRPSNNPCT